MIHSAMERKYFDFNIEKNLKLKKERGISFEGIIAAIANGYLLDIIEHTNKEKYQNQKIYVVDINCYVYLVPFIEKEQTIFLKTIFPSRKLTKKYREAMRGKRNE